MRIIILHCLVLLISLTNASGQSYKKHFTENTLRFDYQLAGNSEEIKVYPLEIKQEPFWSGNHKSLIDQFNLGTYRFKIKEQQSGHLIFMQGFSPLFQEWQTTNEAQNTNRTFYQVIRFPFPKHPVELCIEKRNWQGEFELIYATTINPENYFIRMETPQNNMVEKIIDNGHPNKKVDIAILAEGYTDNEMDKFVSDAQRLSDSLFSTAPFAEMKDHFNVYAVKTISEESGTDVPGEKIYKNTAFNSSFYTFDIPRYLTTIDMKSIHDAAAIVPYDQIYVLVNTERYGGGGFYNFLNVCTSDHELSKEVFIHEFGHGFAGLADEYYNSKVAYEDYYNLNVEPWEPNITTLVDFENKWSNQVNKEIPIPTPRTDQYLNTTGVFEGGGYMSKGIFSPVQDCRMKSNEADGFCPICQQAIIRVIKTYTE